MPLTNHTTIPDKPFAAPSVQARRASGPGFREHRRRDDGILMIVAALFSPTVLFFYGTFEEHSIGRTSVFQVF